VKKGRVRIWTPTLIHEDKELELFFSLVTCMGFAILTTILGLSEALGAFAAGILVNASAGADRHQHQLEPFKLLFLALFFVSIGMLVNLPYVLEHWGKIAFLVVCIFLINTGINFLILPAGQRSWRESWYGGLLLSQFGEFSFVLASVGMTAGIWTSRREHVAYA
jgi:CPA2 family monovalent cation:H+ antiporter-2